MTTWASVSGQKRRHLKAYWLAVGVLGVWEITHLLHAEDGPWGLLERLHARLLDSALGRAVACFYCLSVWVALPCAFVIGETWSERVLLWPALAGGASLLERVTAQRRPPAAVYAEDALPAGADAVLTDRDGNEGARHV